MTLAHHAAAALSARTTSILSATPDGCGYYYYGHHDTGVRIDVRAEPDAWRAFLDDPTGRVGEPVGWSEYVDWGVAPADTSWRAYVAGNPVGTYATLADAEAAAIRFVEKTAPATVWRVRLACYRDRFATWRVGLDSGGDEAEGIVWRGIQVGCRFISLTWESAPRAKRR